MLTKMKVPELIRQVMCVYGCAQTHTQCTRKCPNRSVRKLDIMETKSVQTVTINIFFQKLRQRSKKLLPHCCWESGSSCSVFVFLDGQLWDLPACLVDVQTSWSPRTGIYKGGKEQLIRKLVGVSVKELLRNQCGNQNWKVKLTVVRVLPPAGVNWNNDCFLFRKRCWRTVFVIPEFLSQQSVQCRLREAWELGGASYAQSTDPGARDPCDNWLCELAKVMLRSVLVCSSGNRICSLYGIKFCQSLNWSLNITLLLFSESGVVPS